MYSFFKRILLFAFFIVITLQITSLSTFAMEDENINNNFHIKKNNLENNEQSQLVNNKQKQQYIFTCLSDCLENNCLEYNCLRGNNHHNFCGEWILNIGIYAYNMFAGVCGSDGCYFCKTVTPVHPCCSFSEFFLGSCCYDTYHGSFSDRGCAKSNPCCCKIICCPLDTACHLSCLPVRLCDCCCDCCCGDDCFDFDSTPKKTVYTSSPVYNSPSDSGRTKEDIERSNANAWYLREKDKQLDAEIKQREINSRKKNYF